MGESGHLAAQIVQFGLAFGEFATTVFKPRGLVFCLSADRGLRESPCSSVGANGWVDGLRLIVAGVPVAADEARTAAAPQHTLHAD